jgi:hypothetical protein
LAGLLLGQLLGRQLAQLVVDQRQQLLGGLGVALFDGGQDAGNIGHRRHRNVWAGGEISWVGLTWGADRSVQRIAPD